MRLKGWRKFSAMVLGLLVSWHVAIVGIKHGVDLVALAALVGAVCAAPAAYMGSNVWKAHVRTKNGGKA